MADDEKKSFIIRDGILGLYNNNIHPRMLEEFYQWFSNYIDKNQDILADNGPWRRILYNPKTDGKK